MTAVGKILVFFNLIFSLVVGAFVIFDYINQAHWVADYKDLAARYAVADASNQAYQQQRLQDQNYAQDFDKNVLKDGNLAKLADLKDADDFKTKLQKISDTLKTAQAERDGLKTSLDTLQKDLAATKASADADHAGLLAAQAEADKHQKESQDVRALLTQAEANKLQLVTERDKANDERVAATIRAASFERRATELEKENDRLARDNQRLVSTGGSTTTALKPKDAPNPPLQDVEGLISEVDPDGLVRITIGSDAGLARNQTLEVYRLDTQVPDHSKYVGRVRLIDVRNTQSVGQMIGKPATPPLPNDTVSSQILR